MNRVHREGTDAETPNWPVAADILLRSEPDEEPDDEEEDDGNDKDDDDDGRGDDGYSE